MHFIVTSNKIRLRAIAESPHPVNGDFAKFRSSQQHAEFDWLRGVSIVASGVRRINEVNPCRARLVYLDG